MVKRMGDRTKNRINDLTFIPINFLTKKRSDNYEIKFKKNKILTIGRSRNCDIRIENRYISKLHSIVKAKENGVLPLVKVKCMSSNSLFINSIKKLEKHSAYILKPGDIIHFAKSEKAFILKLTN